MDLPLEENRGRLTYWLFYTERCVTYAYAEGRRPQWGEGGRPYVIPPPQWGALSLLLVQDGMTITAMSQKRGVDAPAVTGIITRLEQIGLVERRHDRQDRRVVRVFLTDEGRDISNTLDAVVEDFEQRMKCGFTESEVDRFLVQLQQLIVNASKIGPGLGDRFGLLPKDML